MFCSKCGTQLPDGAAFCPKCGAKQVVEAASNGEAPKPAVPKAQGTFGKKKSKKLPILIGAVLLLAVVVVVVIAASGGGGIDYKASIRAYTPYAEGQGLPYTFGEVSDKYIENAKWDIHESDSAADARISGTAKGTKQEIAVDIHMDVKGDKLFFGNTSVALDGADQGGNGFFALFVAYGEGDEDMAGYETLVSEIGIALAGNELSGTFSDEASGISFRYPDFWNQRDNTNEFQLINLYSPRNTVNHRATIEFGITGDYYGVFTGDDASVEKEVNDTGTLTFMDFADISLEDVPIRALRYKTEGLNGEDDIVVTIWSMIGQEVYRLALSYTESTAPVYGPIFEAVVDSFSVDSPASYVTREQALAMAQAWCQDSLEIIDEVPGADLPAWISESCYVFEMMRFRMGFAGYLYVDKNDGSIYCSIDLGEKIADMEGISSEEWWNYFYTVVYNMYTLGPSSLDEAQALVDAWLETHRLSSILRTDATDERNGQYVFELWGPGGFIGLIYVSKSDGYLSLYDTYSNHYDLEEWYEATYGAYSP